MVARSKFAAAVKELESSQPVYNQVWRIRHSKYPRIFVDVLSSSSARSIALLLRMENWNFLPPMASFFSSDLRKILHTGDIPGAIENPSNPVHHIVESDGRPAAWICSPGFYEYHEFYPEDRWEKIRDTDGGTITWIVNRACDLVDRRKI